MRLWALGMLIAAMLAAAPARACEGGDCANGLAYAAYGPAKANTLVVFLHGDVSGGGPADYMYAHAKSFAASRKGVVAVALLRPGYYDREGKRSSGHDGGRRDTFHASNNRTIAGAISELKAKYGATRVIGLGHSAGAGTLGVLAGSNAGLLNGVVLASCPCDVRAWDMHRGRQRGSSSQSPIDYLGSVPTGTPIVAVTGSGDENTTPALAEAYISKARALGLPARVQIVGGGHNFGGAIGSTAISALGGMVR
ncbi:MAG: alpha/beta hydrolase family protein [bacterium]